MRSYLNSRKTKAIERYRQEILLRNRLKRKKSVLVVTEQQRESVGVNWRKRVVIEKNRPRSVDWRLKKEKQVDLLNSIEKRRDAQFSDLYHESGPPKVSIMPIGQLKKHINHSHLQQLSSKRHRKSVLLNQDKSRRYPIHDIAYIRETKGGNPSLGSRLSFSSNSPSFTDKNELGNPNDLLKELGLNLNMVIGTDIGEQMKTFQISKELEDMYKVIRYKVSKNEPKTPKLFFMKRVKLPTFSGKLNKRSESSENPFSMYKHKITLKPQP